MSSDYTWMDIFDRGMEGMCYNVNTNGMSSFKNADAVMYCNAATEAAYDSLKAYEQRIQPVKEKLSIKSFPRLVSFCSWHIKRSDLLTLFPIVKSRRDDGRRVEPMYYGGRL